jgi:arylsulfatase A-like enzyme
VGRFSTSGYVHPPSFGEVEAGAPNYIAQRSWSASAAAFNDHSHAQQLDTMFGVDRSIGQLWNALPDNTVVLFMSDNGWHGASTGQDGPVPTKQPHPDAVAGKNCEPAAGPHHRGRSQRRRGARSKGTRA